jgi:hypothetical protein
VRHGKLPHAENMDYGHREYYVRSNFQINLDVELRSSLSLSLSISLSLSPSPRKRLGFIPSKSKAYSGGRFEVTVREWL